jgi:putative heme-binding domain-containing protein
MAGLKSRQCIISTACAVLFGITAHAHTQAGNSERGRAVFSTLTCAGCHSVDGRGDKVGPDLAAIGGKFEKADLIDAIIQPSSSIAVGYDHTLIARKDGGTVAGVIKQVTSGWIELMGADAKAIRVQTADIDRRDTIPLSLMPPNLHLAATPEDFADLIAYLSGLRNDNSTDQEVLKASREVSLPPFFSDEIPLHEPVWFGEIPGRTNAYVVLEHHGLAWIVEKRKAGDVRLPFLDLRSIVRVGGATGLLGMALHPDFPTDRRYFLKYHVIENGVISTLVTERRFSDDLLGDSGEAPRQILKIAAATQDHNGGCIAFGPDGCLYVGMGDTGPQGDPQGHSQDMSILLGKMLRIDINRRENGQPYAIPADNPFVNLPGIRPEIWASGFREPWRFSWDKLTGDLWVGDVGQNRYEEVAIVRAGENHGWNVMEGSADHSARYRKPGVALTPPVWSYSHRIGASVTGGFVYRGEKAPALQGWYIFADHESRRIWALTQKDRKMTQVVEIGRAPTRAVSISQTRDGELYLVGFNSGKIHHLDLSTVDPEPLEVRVLAATSEKSPIISRFTSTDPGTSWTAMDYDDSSWTEAAGGYGSPGTPGGVIRTEWRGRAIWLRREFIISENRLPDAESRLMLRIHHDEDAKVHLNGVPVAELPRWTQGYVEIPLSREAASTVRVGRNVIAIQCTNNGGGQYIDAGLVELVPRR